MGFDTIEICLVFQMPVSVIPYFPDSDILVIVRNLASFNGKNEKVACSAEIYRDYSLA